MSRASLVYPITPHPHDGFYRAVFNPPVGTTVPEGAQLLIPPPSPHLPGRTSPRT